MSSSIHNGGAPARPSLKAQLLQPPNMISWGRIVVVFIAAALFINGWQVTGLVIGFFAGIGDYWDGILARRLGLVSDLGAALDQWSDNVYEGLILVYGAITGVFPRWVVIAYLFREFSIIFIRTVSRDRGLSISSGIWGKIKTNFLHCGILFAFMGEMAVFPMPARSVFSMLGWMGAVGGLLFSYASGVGYVRQFLAQYDVAGSPESA